MTSRKESPSFTSMSDLAVVIPMLVPRPPFSFTTTAWSRVEPSDSGSSSAFGRSVSGVRSEERRVGKSVDLGGRRIIKKKKQKKKNNQRNIRLKNNKKRDNNKKKEYK